jgi:glyoxylase-like metal-dependent hydrolase (beta-lactamase superfamily II)
MAANGMQIDAMMLSHSDKDHTGGALAVKAAQPRAKVWGSDSVIQARNWRAWLRFSAVHRGSTGNGMA